MFGRKKDILEIGFEKNGKKHIFKQVDVSGMSDYEKSAVRAELQRQMESYLEATAEEMDLDLESELQGYRRANEHLKEENMDLRNKVDVLKDLLKESYRYGQD